MWKQTWSAMEDSSSTWLVISLSATIILLLVLERAKSENGARGKTLPRPRGWPVIGNLLVLGTMPHRSLYQLAREYGLVIWLKLGSIDTLVIQSAKAAENKFKNHDLAFSNRMQFKATSICGFAKGAIVFVNYEPNWRVSRKVCTEGFLSNVRINEIASLMRQNINQLIGWIEDEVKVKPGEVEVQIDYFLLHFSFNSIGQLVLSRDVLDLQSKEGPGLFDDWASSWRWVQSQMWPTICHS